MKQEMMGWQWHQLDRMQIICTLLQTDNHATTSSLKFLQAGSTNSVKALKAKNTTYKYHTNTHWPCQPEAWTDDHHSIITDCIP